MSHVVAWLGGCLFAWVGSLAAIAQEPASPVTPAPADPGGASAPAVLDQAAPDARMAWWRDARFGMFIHWGLYAIPAGAWNDATHHGEWIRDTAQIPVEDYEALKAKWNPTAFDAARWADIAAKAGMKYVVITTKHHDGFCLFDSAHTDWDVMSTPFQRDVMKEIAQAFRARGIRVCWYHSIMDWHNPDYLPRRPWETTRSSEGADLERYVKYLHAQVEELLTNYGDIGVLWFDGEWESSWTHERGKALYELCRRLQPNVIVNNRVDVSRAGLEGFSADRESFGDFGTPEQTIPAQGLPGVDWETCMTMNGHWGFNRADQNWKSAAEMIRMLCDIASKGGNFLMNVGPTAEGEFPPACVERLEAMGAWLAINGEAIYGTSASVFTELPWGRCTVKSNGSGTRLYLHVFDWPKDGRLVVPGLGNDPVKAYLLARPDTALTVTRAEADVVVGSSGNAPDAVSSVVVLELAEAPIVYRAPTIEADSDGFVAKLEVRVNHASPAIELRATTDGTEPTARSPQVIAPLVLDRSATVKARAFHAGKPVSRVVERAFSKLEPNAPVVPKGRIAAGLAVLQVRGAFAQLPDFATLTASALRIAPTVELIAAERREDVAHRFEGLLHVGDSDYWRFALTSDDGARLWLDGALVIDLDGLHSEATKVGGIALRTGFHRIVVEHFNRSGNTSLGLRMGRLGTELAPIPATSLAHEP
ncbi:MAG: alpha-L-fucosidase [Planctomycetes bacterium]|nr:alpha-L-fucosidase [Planctomycetota bacterium]